jgi:Cu/Ag efflux protein CusF
MKKAIAIIVSVLFVFALTSLSFAAEKAAPAKMEEKKAPAKIKQVTGEVTAVDAKAKTVTVKGKKGDVTVSTDDKTKVTMGKEMKSVADVKVGDKVIVKYSEADGKNVAKSVAIKPAAAPAEKKTEAAKPAEKPTKTEKK